MFLVSTMRSPEEMQMSPLKKYSVKSSAITPDFSMLAPGVVPAMYLNPN
jgi:hypothetical protein